MSVTGAVLPGKNCGAIVSWRKWKYQRLQSDHWKTPWLEIACYVRRIFNQSITGKLQSSLKQRKSNFWLLACSCKLSDQRPPHTKYYNLPPPYDLCLTLSLSSLSWPLADQDDHRFLVREWFFYICPLGMIVSLTGSLNFIVVYCMGPLSVAVRMFLGIL